MTENNAPILFEERACDDGHRIGVATLNAPKSLNALSLDMIKALYDQLLAWRSDDGIAIIWLQGAEDRAFCAGGDIVQLYHSMHEHPQGPNPYALEFFSREYRLDYLIHKYPKPIVVWGTGFVMGGGLGLMTGASHRIVTETSRLAMPEISIGLFPDVGGTWFLSRMPAGIGLFLGLTASQCNAADALELDWADYFLPQSQKDNLLSSLTRLQWTSYATNHTRVTQTLRSLQEQHQTQCPIGEVQNHREFIKSLIAHDSLLEIAEAIRHIDTDDKWLTKARANFLAGCPVSAHLLDWQIRHGKALSLAEVFRKELIMAIQCTQHPDFPEGVRALLIDKDQKPDWHFKTIEEVPEAYLEQHLKAPWLAHGTTEHPLVDLESI